MALLSWFRAKHPVVRFVLALAGLVFFFEVLLTTDFVLESVVRRELDLFAKMLGMILGWLGEESAVHGQIVDGSRFSVKIVQGCDALRPALLFVSAVLASPVAWWPKLPGLILGTVFLMLMNLVRLVVLYFVGVHYPSAFDFMHRDVSQVGFILLVILTWVTWALWAVRRPTREPHVSA